MLITLLYSSLVSITDVLSVNMKLATIFYLHNLLICAKGGFIKNLLGTVTDGVHEVSHGIIESVSHTFDEAANVI